MLRRVAVGRQSSPLYRRSRLSGPAGLLLDDRSWRKQPRAFVTNRTVKLRDTGQQAKLKKLPSTQTAAAALNPLAVAAA